MWYGACIFLTWLIHMCDMTLSCVWHVSLMWDMTFPHLWQHSFMFFTRLKYHTIESMVSSRMNEACHTYEWGMSYIFVSHVTHMNHLQVCHDSFHDCCCYFRPVVHCICVPWLIYMCAMTHVYVCHDSIMCAMTHSYIHIRDIIQSHVWHEPCYLWHGLVARLLLLF